MVNEGIKQAIKGLLETRIGTVQPVIENHRETFHVGGDCPVAAHVEYRTGFGGEFGKTQPVNAIYVRFADGDTARFGTRKTNGRYAWSRS